MKMNKLILAMPILMLVCFVQWNSNVWASKHDITATEDVISSFNNLERAKVRHVVDGDSINIYTGDNITRVRLYGIDCMETSNIHRAYRQAYENKITIEDVIAQGNFATKKLDEIIKKNQNWVYFRTMGIDHYGRLLAVLYDKDFNIINDMMLESEYCKAFMVKKTNSQN